MLLGNKFKPFICFCEDLQSKRHVNQHNTQCSKNEKQIYDIHFYVISKGLL